MFSSDSTDRLKQYEIAGRVTMLEGNGELPKIEANSDGGTAEIYLHGATVTDFRKRNEPPVLFTSRCSRFAVGQPIRGGVPIIFPWFGPREGEPSHGFARSAEWELHETSTVPEGGVSLRFGLPNADRWATLPPFIANYIVTVTDKLGLELVVTNASADQEFSIETCLHTYFVVGEIGGVSISGLKGQNYLDAVENYALNTEAKEHLTISGETDRIYLDSTGPVEILDQKLARRIRIEKSGSASTVVWNPWSAKAQQMPDFGNEEYRQMVCVESGNVRKNRIVLAPGKSSVLSVVLSTAAL